MNEGLDDAQREEIVRLLVKQITVHSEVEPEGKKAKVLIEYRFGVVNTAMAQGFMAPTSMELAGQVTMPGGPIRPKDRDKKRKIGWTLKRRIHGRQPNW